MGYLNGTGYKVHMWETKFCTHTKHQVKLHRSIDHSRNCCPHRSGKEVDIDKPGLTVTLEGKHSGQAALRRMQL
jgi:hypothetical protein